MNKKSDDLSIKKTRTKTSREEFEEQKKFMDEPPHEDLKEELRDEKKKFKSKQSSKSERKHKSNQNDAN
ncbi:MAG TPA: hypothetical protein VK097_00340 [Lentibacillus sp.]|uniref:hypothetical protein n=1 Tax=Lentibacillus sp. TaxID=1925746 RepID=UPI002B4B65F0|nr:hypothetical protein [Lentibacillus sp.]HLR60871.1 hypothetical protein [Lentibacillus sp.]